jgi:hypothetical protein
MDAGDGVRAGNLYLLPCRGEVGQLKYLYASRTTSPFYDVDTARLEVEAREQAA